MRIDDRARAELGALHLDATVQFVRALRLSEAASESPHPVPASARTGDVVVRFIRPWFAAEFIPCSCEHGGDDNCRHVLAWAERNGIAVRMREFAHGVLRLTTAGLDVSAARAVAETRTVVANTLPAWFAQGRDAAVPSCGADPC